MREEMFGPETLEPAVKERFVADYTDGTDRYTVPYHGRTFSCALSPQQLDGYVRACANIARELLRLYKETGCFAAEFEGRGEGPGQDEEVLRVMRAFAEGGVFATPALREGVARLGELRGLPLDSASWLLMARPSVCSAVYYLAEGMRKAQLDDSFESLFMTAEYMLRSALVSAYGQSILGGSAQEDEG